MGPARGRGAGSSGTWVRSCSTQGTTGAYYDLARATGSSCLTGTSFPTPRRTTRPRCTSWATGRATPDRLNRETLVRGTEAGFWSTLYAREELRAEISSMMTGDRLNLGHDPLASRRLRAVVGQGRCGTTPREIYRASRDAQVMSDYLLDRDRGAAAGAREPHSIRRARRARTRIARRRPSGRADRRGEKSRTATQSGSPVSRVGALPRSDAGSGSRAVAGRNRRRRFAGGGMPQVPKATGCGRRSAR